MGLWLQEVIVRLGVWCGLAWAQGRKRKEHGTGPGTKVLRNSNDYN